MSVNAGVQDRLSWSAQLDEASFTAADRNGEKVLIDADFVERHIGDLAANADLSRSIL
jgi:ATP-dependent HslUV protease ATP-binding subunit HslU